MSDNTELSFIRCPSCRSLVPAMSAKCRMCGFDLSENSTAEKSNEVEKDPLSAYVEGYDKEKTDVKEEVVAPEEISLKEESPLIEEEKELNDQLVDSISNEELSQSEDKLAFEEDEDSDDDFLDKLIKDLENEDDDEEDEWEKLKETSELQKSSKDTQVIKFSPNEDQKDSKAEELDDVFSDDILKDESDESDEFDLDFEDDNDLELDFSDEDESQEELELSDNTQESESLELDDTDELDLDFIEEDEVNQDANIQEEVEQEEVELEPIQSALLTSKSTDDIIVGWLIGNTNNREVSYEIRSGKFFISGTKLKDTDLVISESNISTPHALVNADREGFVIQDLMSDSGVFIKKNGDSEYIKTEKPEKLNSGDCIKLGNIEYLFVGVPR